jgi:hypothetical protein
MVLLRAHRDHCPRCGSAELRRPEQSDTSDPPRPRAARLTCADIEAIVYAKLGWPPHAGSAQEYAETAAIVGYSPGLDSQIQRSE